MLKENIFQAMLEKCDTPKDIYLKRYLNICLHYKALDIQDEYCEDHHIMPRALWPEYSNFNEHEWNKVNLPIKAHVLVHYILSKIYNSMWDALFLISGRNPNTSIKIVSEARLEFIKYLNTVDPITGLSPAQIRGAKTKQTKLDNNVYEEAGKKLSLWLNSIDEETGLSNGKLRAKLVNQDSYRDNLGMSLREFASLRIKGDSNPSKDPSTKQKISKTLKKHFENNDNPFKGKTHSEESLKIMKEKKQGENNPCFNKIWVNNGISNLRVDESNIPDGYIKGRLINFDTKKKKKLTCPYCNKIGASGNMKRYHMENCKQNINTLPV